MVDRKYWGLLLAIAGAWACKPAAAPASTSTTGTASNETTASAAVTPPAASSSAGAPSAPDGRRLSAKQLADLGPAGEGPCHAPGIPPDVKVGACRAAGPYQGILSGTSKGEATPDYTTALEACHETPECIGVSSVWYSGSPWYPVLGAEGFAVDEASYGCTLLLDCGDEK